jgi:hypothetical protein
MFYLSDFGGLPMWLHEFRLSNRKRKEKFYKENEAIN